VLDLSPTKLIIIFVVVILLLGPKRLPQVARQLGAGWRKIVSFQQQVERELRETVPDLPSSQDIVRFARSPVTMLNQLAEFPRAHVDDLVEDPGAPAPTEGAAPDDDGASDGGDGGDGGGDGGGPDGGAIVDGAQRPTGTESVPAAERSGDDHWPEDRSTARSPAPSVGNGTGIAPPGAPARPGSRLGALDDLRALSADDPTMN
jgi:TatA/E family protein of Tat protein translocase